MGAHTEDETRRMEEKTSGVRRSLDGTRRIRGPELGWNATGTKPPRYVSDQSAGKSLAIRSYRSTGWLSELHCEAFQRLFRNCCDRDCVMRAWQSSWNPELTKRDVNRSSFPTAGEGTAVARRHRDTSGLAEATANNYRFRKSQTETSLSTRPACVSRDRAASPQ